MSRRTNPVDKVVQFFETAPIETAVVVLAIVKGIVARRAPKTKAVATGTPARQPKPRAPTLPSFPPNREIREGDWPAREGEATGPVGTKGGHA